MLVVSATTIGPDLAANAANGQRFGAWRATSRGRLGDRGVQPRSNHEPVRVLFPGLDAMCSRGHLRDRHHLADPRDGRHPEYVIAPLLTYTGLALSATFLSWLLWFGH